MGQSGDAGAQAQRVKSAKRRGRKRQDLVPNVALGYEGDASSVVVMVSVCEAEGVRLVAIELDAGAKPEDTNPRKSDMVAASLDLDHPDRAE